LDRTDDDNQRQEIEQIMRELTVEEGKLKEEYDNITGALAEAAEEEKKSRQRQAALAEMDQLRQVGEAMYGEWQKLDRQLQELKSQTAPDQAKIDALQA
jgi:predicted transcriptional regulator